MYSYKYMSRCLAACRPDRCITGRVDPGMLSDKVEIDNMGKGSVPLALINMAAQLSFEDSGGHYNWQQSFQNLWGSVVQITDAVAKGGTVGFFCYDSKTLQGMKGIHITAVLSCARPHMTVLQRLTVCLHALYQALQTCVYLIAVLRPHAL